MDLRLVIFTVVSISAQCAADRMSREEIKAFVDAHNARREALAADQVPGQPAATNMKRLVWDDKLANNPSRWAAGRQFMHNPDNTIAGRMSCEEIKAFVDGHNARREALAAGQVPGQPAATNMKRLVWDDELANKASRWAAGRQFMHNPDNTIGSKRFTTGENIHMSSTSDPDAKFDVQQPLDAWFMEYKDYHRKKLDAGDFGGGPQTGHFTQMAWAKTTRVGCGKAEYMQNGFKTFFVVCNYGPSGNFIDQYPYEVDGPKTGKLECNENYCSKLYGNKC